MQAVAAQGLELATLSAGDELTLGGAQVNVLAPASELESVNDNSIVLRITYGDGAADDPTPARRKNRRCSRARELQADLIKVGHHGSSGSTSAALLAGQPRMGNHIGRYGQQFRPSARRDP